MKFVKSIALLSCLSAVLVMAPGALADEPETEPAAPPPAPAAPGEDAAGATAAQPPGAVAQPDEESEIKRFTITANPLSIAVGRYSINVEYMLSKHNGLIAVPSLWMLSASSADVEWKYRYLGGELGYHFYTGDRGANGFFVGPSLVYMNMNTSMSAPGIPDSSASTSVYGVAIDAGGQHVAHNGFTIGGGVGFMYLKVATKPEGASKPSINLSGVLPRFLFTIGYSF